MRATGAPARTSRSVNGRPAARSAPTISAKLAEAPSTSTVSLSLLPARAVRARPPITEGTITCTPTSRTASPSRRIVGAYDASSGRRRASRSDGGE